MKKKTNKGSKKLVSVLNTSNFRLLEAYKALRTNILFALPASEYKGCRKIVITSSTPGEGKTTTAVNIAVTMAETESRVLLIDTDMRKSRVHEYFGIDGKVGVSTVVTGMSTLAESVFKVESIPNLSVLPAGVQPLHPAELLNSSAMKKMLEELENDYDFIIIDTPPVNIVSDALCLVSNVDGVAVVVSRGLTTYTELQKSVESLKFAHANIIGFVYNNSEEDANKLFHGRYGKYGKYGNYYSYSSYGDKVPAEKK